MKRALAHREIPASRAALRELFFAAHDAKLASARAALLEARRARTAAIESVREIMVMRDDCPEPRVARRLVRGA